MPSGRIHIRQSGGAIYRQGEEDTPDGGSDLLRAHAISVTDVDVLGGDGNTEHNILLTAVVEDTTGTTATIRLALPVDTAEIMAISLALSIDAAHGRTS